MSGRLQDKVTLVTGAGSGLGQATAERFAEEGAVVIGTDINLEAVEAVAAGIREAGGKATAHHQDVAEESGWDSLFSETVAAHGRLDALVNNAGAIIPGSAEEATLEDWRTLMAVNLDSVFMGTRAAIRVMKDNGGGSIINISSIDGIIGEAAAAAYNASKGGVRIFSKSAALHCAQNGYGIRVNSVHPGFIRTPMLEGALEAAPPEQIAEWQQYLMRDIPMAALGEPVDIANGCLYLASDESKYMTGAELVIDGGYTCR